jgi:hypothetical protein
MITVQTGMQSLRKPFNQALHDQYDPPAREAVTKWVKMKWGLECRENPNVYGVDLLVYRADKLVGYIEVEVRGWRTATIPPFIVRSVKRNYFSKISLCYFLH